MLPTGLFFLQATFRLFSLRTSLNLFSLIQSNDRRRARSCCGTRCRRCRQRTAGHFCNRPFFPAIAGLVGLSSQPSPSDRGPTFTYPKPIGGAFIPDTDRKDARRKTNRLIRGSLRRSPSPPNAGHIVELRPNDIRLANPFDPVRLGHSRRIPNRARDCEIGEYARDQLYCPSAHSQPLPRDSFGLVGALGPLRSLRQRP